MVVKSEAEIINELFEEIKNLQEVLKIKDQIISHQQVTIDGWKSLYGDAKDNQRKADNIIKKLRRLQNHGFGNVMIYRSLTLQLDKELREIKDSFRTNNKIRLN